MAEKVKRKIRKWDEVNGATEIEDVADPVDAVEAAGAGPSISRNYMRGIEDMVEQNDNSFDGVINNTTPQPEPDGDDLKKITEREEKAAEERESVIAKIKEQQEKTKALIPPEPQKKPRSLCPDREMC
ncbi:DUF4316 domain-containing protein [Butyrivibrio sp. INlla14]|uniref:DUF4316 domain-containing protein n=1 Tax=Butyrivibrio sp. INlla14 TaxID=1520808 RepID=UPI000876315E|nr:DUF4316 domain-containing protein [Butyrivibrio sp. INlla14]SCY11144.1 protein of unknown function [Butyrivibrio sp. INlla14]